MDKHEYAIFTNCAEWPFPLYNVLLDIGRDIDVAAAASLFHRLFVRGDLFARTSTHRRFGKSGDNASNFSRDRFGQGPIIPCVEQVETAILIDEPPLVFGMTEQGAKRWEALARPDWDRYVNVSETCLDSNGAEFETNLSALTRSRLEMAVQAGYLGTCMLGSEKWEPVSPWHATYWKAFPTGWHLRLRTRIDWEIYKGERAAEMANFFTWFKSLR